MIVRLPSSHHLFHFVLIVVVKNRCIRSGSIDTDEYGGCLIRTSIIVRVILRVCINKEEGEEEEEEEEEEDIIQQSMSH